MTHYEVQCEVEDSALEEFLAGLEAIGVTEVVIEDSAGRTNPRRVQLTAPV